MNPSQRPSDPWAAARRTPSHHSTGPPSGPSHSTGSNRQAILQARAEETKNLIPEILALRPRDPAVGRYVPKDTIAHLESRYNPNLSAQVEVVNGDTFDSAIQLAASSTSSSDSEANVCVLNMASEKNPGGGWVRGTLAQEEELCYRSTLSFTLRRRFYPIKKEDALYSPSVVIFRENFTTGHKLKDLEKPELLPVISVISIAALRRPDVNTRMNPPRYMRPHDREIMKEKMRTTLRIAALNKHRKLVLGALGCGAFANPKEEVANCWAEVFQEQEFKGWWQSIVFAVLDNTVHPTSDGNFNIFHSRLQGLRI
ncbi:hypothetical protein FE257_009602 [Aspergillus nanangensis]|uniref:Microbial-type PARG catalytic domain-containing protein n=1 Tax=Aspergillus nanangensis TaxID=2582783 RepID=A0AAD4CJQ2_ASPNN|nr:hypothetical protein FE257_009602 [Aspergillus nanangensis]